MINDIFAFWGTFMKYTKFLSLLLVFSLTAALLASCKDNVSIDLGDVVNHEDYTSVYDMIGSNITIDMVKEDEDTGLAYVEYEGREYELGLDFLSMAMVYNCTPAGDYKTADEVYCEWWKLFIQRYNYMALEIPLYSNQYYDIYNSKIENFKTSPYRSAAAAVISAKVKDGNKNSVTLGGATQLSGAFRNSAWGKSSPGASDLDIEELTTGYSTVETDIDGSFRWNLNVLVSEPDSKLNDDGTITYTLKIKEGLVFSDGSPIGAKNYIAYLLANSTPVFEAAGGSGASGLNFEGYDEFSAYDGENHGKKSKDGENEVTASRYFSGVKLLGDYEFSVTLKKDYSNYYYSMTYASFSPVPMGLYLGENDITAEAETKACGLSDGFYEKVNKNGADIYSMVETVNRNLAWDSPFPYSGPYVVSDYNPSSGIATLTLNERYSGDLRGKASVKTVTYVRVVEETQLDQLKTGQIDVLAGVTGAKETEAALALVKASGGKYSEVHYDRAGYGFIGLRCDLGPMSITSARQAVMYTINRNEFARQFTGGYGSVVHGPYYEGFSAYRAVEDDILINPYSYSPDSAVEILEEDGWIYNSEGKEYEGSRDAVRYRKLSGYELSRQNLEYATVDGKYKTVKIDGDYYMPLAINWYGTQPNSVTDMLITSWQTNENSTKRIGAYIQYISCEFVSGLYGDYLQMSAYGYGGVARCTAINYATGFNSAAYDMSFAFTIDPVLYANYSRAYFMDEADFYENYEK